jgi:hypothetical protein
LFANAKNVRERSLLRLPHIATFDSTYPKIPRAAWILHKLSAPTRVVTSLPRCVAPHVHSFCLPTGPTFSTGGGGGDFGGCQALHDATFIVTGVKSMCSFTLICTFAFDVLFVAGVGSIDSLGDHNVGLVARAESAHILTDSPRFHT